MAWYQGPSRITVTAVEGRFSQRAVVTVRGAAPVELAGEVGAVHLVDAESWQLDLEHRHLGDWCPNIRAVQGRWQEIRGVLTQVVYSRNRDMAGDRQDRNLVLRIERVVPGGDESPTVTRAPAVRRTTAAHHVPAVSAGSAAPRTSAGGPGGTTAPGVRTSGSGVRVTGSGGPAGTTTSTTSWSG